MEERKTVTVKLDVYEDQEDEFRAIIYFLKKTLNDDSIENLIRNNYKDPSGFDLYGKRYTNFLQDFFGMIQLDKSGEGEHLSLSDDNSKPKELKISNARGSKRPDWKKALINDAATSEKISLVKGFIGRMTKVADVWEDKAIEELIYYITYLIMDKQIEYFQIDKFTQAASNADLSIRTGDLRHLINMWKITDRPFLSNIVLQRSSIPSSKSVKTDKKYRLAGDLLNKIEFFFPQLYQKDTDTDYSLRVIIGFVLSELNILLKEGEFLETKKGSKPWKDYLAETVLTWLKRGSEKHIYPYPPITRD